MPLLSDGRRPDRRRTYDPGALPMPDNSHDPQIALQAWQQLQQHGGLVGVSDLAERWKVDRSTAGKLTKKPGFPPVREHRGGTQLWLSAEVDHWRRAWDERSDKPGPAPRFRDEGVDVLEHLTPEQQRAHADFQRQHSRHGRGGTER